MGYIHAMYFKETALKGLAISKGIAVARTCMFNEQRHSNLAIYKVSGTGVDKELARLKQAVLVAGQRLDHLRQKVADSIGTAESEIFTAQRMILEDPSLSKKVETLIRGKGINAEAAIASVLDAFEVQIKKLDDEYLRERSTDFGEVKRRMLDVLSNMNPAFQCSDKGHCQRGQQRIVIARELTPSLTMDLDTKHTLGFVTERGGVNSHAAILARALGIPAVSNLPGIHGEVACGSEVLINGFTGEVVIHPADATIIAAREKYGHAVRTPVAVDPVPGFVVMANISTALEVDIALDMKAEGIGLYRTEFEMLSSDRLLTEDEQADRYSAIVKSMNGLPVTFRLLDIGGDKPLSFLDMPQEDNPYLGWRGVRLLMDRKDLFETQARAMARASLHGDVNILYPMVIDLDQFRRAKAMFEQFTSAMAHGVIRHGAMFEVPSACLDAVDILRNADFGSIGTNDLIQYLFAVDRNNELVAYDYKPERPALWKLIRTVASAGLETGKPVSVCGELAGDPQYSRQLFDAGIRTVSTSPRLIPGVRTAAAGFAAPRPA